MKSIVLDREKNPLKMGNAILLTIGTLFLLPHITMKCMDSILNGVGITANSAIFNTLYFCIMFCLTLYFCYKTNIIKPNESIIKMYHNKKVIIILCLTLEYCSTDVFIRVFVLLPLNDLWIAYDEMVEGINNYNWLSFFTLVIIAPMAEEMLFRGILFNSIKEKLSIRKAAVVSSLFFSFAHVNVLQCIPTFFSGIIYCIVYEKYNSLMIIMLMHISNNFLAYLGINLFQHSIAEVHIIIAVLEVIIVYLILNRIIKH